MTDTSSLPDIGTLDFWTRSRAHREEAFAWLRRNEPISWHPPAESLLLPPELNTKGFWAITKYEHIREISRQPTIFSNESGVFMEDLPPEGVAALSFLAKDPPSHTQLRGIVEKALRPSNVRKLESWIGDLAHDLVADLAEKGSGDIVKDIAKPLPGAIFARYIGVEDPQMRDRVIWAADQLVSWADPEYMEKMAPAEIFMGAAQILAETALELAPLRRQEPGEDMVTWVVEADFDGRSMTDQEIGAFFVLLGGAANDTTGHTISNSLLALDQFPEQKKLLLDDFEGRIDGAIEEFLRFRPPVMHFRRTALQDYGIGGKTIKAGDKVVLWYVSGCRDEDMFENPDQLDITRQNSMRHIAFGGGGPHFCLGNALGRSVLKGALREIFAQLPDLELGEPEFYPSNFMNNVRRLPATW